jgi:hypothetical protein
MKLKIPVKYRVCNRFKCHDVHFYYVLKFKNRKQVGGFSCLISNENDKAAKAEADSVCAALNLKEAIKVMMLTYRKKRRSELRAK